MLVLTRKPGEKVVIDGGIQVIVTSIQGSQVRLGFIAPDGVTIVREEVALMNEATVLDQIAPRKHHRRHRV